MKPTPLRSAFLPLACLVAFGLNPTVRAEEDEDADPGPDQENLQIQIEAGQLNVVEDEPEDAAPDKPQDANAPAAEAKADDNSPSWMGLQLDMNEPGQFDEDEKPPAGVGITDVMKEGPAEKAGLKALDRVLKIDDTAVNTSQELRTTVRAIKAGTEVKVLISREDKEQTIKVVLEKMPAQANIMRIQGFGGYSGKPDKVHFYNTPPRPSDPTGVDVVLLRDGNRLEGQVRELSATSLKFHLLSGPDVDLDQTRIESVKLSGGTAETKASAALMLREGGWLIASDARMKEGRVTVTMEGQPEISMARAAVSEIFLQPKSATVLYQGPSAQDGWKANPAKGWQLTDDGWQASPEGNATLSRKFPALPGSVAFSFDLTLAPELTTQFSLFGFRADVYGGAISPGMLQFQVNQGTLTVTQFDGLNYFTIAHEGGQQAPKLGITAGKPAHLEFLCDREKGLMIVTSNGREVGKYKLAKVGREDLPRAGRVIQFLGSRGMAVSNLALRPWYGSVPADKPTAQDAVLAAQATAAQEGPVTGITAEGVVLADGHVLKRKDTLQVVLHEDAPAPKLNHPPVWIEMRAGSNFAATSVTFSNGQAVAMTTFAGKVSLPLAGIRLLTFPNPAGPEADQRQMDVLSFRDGQQLHGTFAPPVADGLVKWKISAAAQPLTFAVKEIQAILLTPKSDPVTRPVQVVKMCNGDWLAGEMLTADATGIVLKTAFHDALLLPARQMSAFYPGPTAAVIADGGSGRKRWRELTNRASMNLVEEEADEEAGSASSYRYLDGSYSLQRYGSDFGNGDGLVLPITETMSPVSVEFTLSGVENWISMQLKDQSKQVACTISCSGARVQANPRQNMQVLAGGRIIINGGGGSTFQMPSKRTINDSRVPFQIVMDSRQHAMHIYCDRVRIGTVKIPDPWRAIRSLTLFPSTNGRSKFKISDVWISPWVETASATEPDQPWVALSNGDGATGRISGLKGPALEVDLGDLGLMPLPTSRITSLVYPNSPAQSSEVTYRVRLHDSGVLTATECHVEERRIILLTELGEFTLPMEMVKEIVFPSL